MTDLRAWRPVLLASLLAFGTFACGGGSGSGSFTGDAGDGGDVTDPGPGPGDGDGDGDAGDTAALTVSLQDPDTNETVTTLALGSARQVRATWTDAAGDPVSGEVVVVSTDVGELSPDSGRVLTDADGVATATLTAGDAQVGEAGILTVADDDGTVQATLNFEVVAAGDGGTGAGDVPEIAVDLRDPETGEVANGVDPLGAMQVRVSLTDAAGRPLEAEVVSVATDLGSLTPESGRILTGADGVATARLAAGEAEVGAAGTLTVADATGEAQATLNFEIVEPPVQLGAGAGDDFTAGALEILAPSLSAGGSTPVTVRVRTDDGEAFADPIDVVFTSDCVEGGLATLDETVTARNGEATSTYAATGCEGTDLVRAALVDFPDIEATGEIDVDATEVSALQFVSAEPEAIALEGTGGAGRPENATLTFRVTDVDDQPKSGVEVGFALSTDAGGLSLGSSSAVSDGDGEVSVQVSSGTVPTTVRVIATIELADGSEVSTVSDLLTVGTGIPDEDSFSLSASVLNPGGFDFDGVTTTLTIRAADAFNNPVVDGTAVNFRTEFGAIEDSCTTVDGVCSVTWTSQDPRGQLTFDYLTVFDAEFTERCPVPLPSDRVVPCPVPLPRPDDSAEEGAVLVAGGGRSTVLATALGEESFVDANGNGVYDAGEDFEDLPEAFVDHNEDGDFGNPNTVGSCAQDGTCNDPFGDQEETFVDLDGDGNYDDGNGIYDGRLCSDDALAAGECSRSLVHVREDLVLLMSGSAPYGAFFDLDARYIQDQAVEVGGGPVGAAFVVADRFNGILPAETTVSFEATDCSELVGETDFTIGSINAPGPRVFPLTIEGVAEDDDPVGGRIEATVTVPAEVGGDGAETFSLQCRPPAG